MNKYYRKDHIITVFLSLMAGLVISSSLCAQKPNFKFKSIKQSDGLANSTVQAIFEDSFGFIWLGTQQGVQRYDGKSYKNFTNTDTDSTGLSQNYINGFGEDAERNIWINTLAGLNKYNRKTDNIERYIWRDKSITENGEPNLPGLMIDPSNKNILWVTAIGVGLIRLDITNDTTYVYPLVVETGRIYTWMLPYPGDTDRLLLGSTKLVSFDKKSGIFTEILSLEQNTEIPNNMINAATIDPANNDIIWLATGDYWGRGSLGGLIKYNLITGESQVFSMETRKGEIPGKHMISMCFHDKNNLWIGTRNDGALLYRLDEDRFYNYKNNEYHEGSFVTIHAVRSILSDRSGTCWFGTWGDGISILSPAAQKFSHYKHLPDDPNGPPDNFISAFAEDKEGNIWIGTGTGGLARFNPGHKTFENHYQEIFSSGQDAINITYLFYDSRDNLWVGTHDDALYRFNTVSGAKDHYKEGYSLNNVTQKRITAIAEFEPGEILISTYGGGLNIFSYKTNTFRHYLHDPKDSSSIPDNQIWLPFKCEDGNYYFSGNSMAKLIQFNPITEKFKHFLSSGITTFLMPLITSDGTIYIDDVSNGLTELRLVDEVGTQAICDANGNKILNLESMLEDSEGMLWLGTGNGLLEFDPVSELVKRYDADDGLQGNEFNRLAAIISSTGEMYFGGKNGFNVFHPDEISLSNYKPPIIFADFKLYQERVPIGEDSPLKQNILLTDEVILDHEQNDFSVSFASLDYSNPDNIEYKYILENHDEDWINVGHNNVASYTNMDPGEYTLKVMATNGDGVWKEEAESIRIIIHPPWWLTKWAYLVYVLILIAGVILFDRIQRKRLLEKEKAQAREKELAQAKEIEKAYTTLKATQDQLLHSEKMASLGELTAGIAHEIQNPLNFVNNFSEVNRELISELKEEIEKGDLDEVKTIANDIERNENKITHHGKRADGIVKGMLLHSRSGAGNKEPSNINILADEYLRLSYHGLRAKDKSFNAEFITDFDKSIPPLNIVPQDVGRVVLNLINNAFHAVSEKNALGIDGYKPLVMVITKLKKNHVTVSVKDNGNGIPNDILDKIYQPFFTTKAAGEGTGLGLSLSYDIITKGHGGKLKVETEAGNGTEFIIVLPL